MKFIYFVVAVFFVGCSASDSSVGPSTESSTSVDTTVTTETPNSSGAEETTSTTAVTEGLPSSASEIAIGINEIESKILRSNSPDEISKVGLRQQVLYQVLDARPELAAQVRASLEAENRAAFDLHWEAKTSLTALVNTENLSSTLPAWRLVEPLPAEELIDYYKEAEAETGIEWEYLAAINLVETRMGRIEGVSTAGAKGPMQFLPTTWEECCVGDQTVPRDAIVGAGTYLVQRGGPEDMDAAIFGYNNSQRYVAAVQAYAELLRQNPNAYYAVHSWEVFFRSSAGLLLLPQDYLELEPIDVAVWLEDNPDAVFKE